MTRASPTPKQPPLDVTFDASACGVRKALAGIRAAMDQQDVPQGDLGNLEIVLAEVLNNIVEHAYGQDSIGPISLRVQPGYNAYRVTVSDEGLPMPDACVPSPKWPDFGQTTANLPEGGFGWLLIHQLAQDIAYRRTRGRNVVAFSLPRSDPGR